MLDCWIMSLSVSTLEKCRLTSSHVYIDIEEVVRSDLPTPQVLLTV